MSRKTTVAVAGATGVLGSLIVQNLLQRGALVRALVRPASADGGDRLAHLAGNTSLSLHVGDLTDGPDALADLVSGADIVVSAVQGGPDVVMDGQLNLLRAAATAGVPRIIPSDFSINMHRLDYGSNVAIDMRKKVAEAVDRSPVARTSVLVGAFPEYFLSPFHEIVDAEAGTFSFWGDGDQLIDMTTMADTAAYTAAVALDPGTAGRTLHFAGQTLSLMQLHEALQAATQRNWTLRPLGTLDDLQAEIIRRQAAASSFIAYVALQYQYGMYTGQAALTDPHNADYPDISPASVAQYLANAEVAQLRPDTALL